MNLKNTIITVASLAAASSLSATLLISVTNNVPNGISSGGTGTGPGLFTITTDPATAPAISSDRLLPVITYAVSNLDLTSVGGTSSESFTFTLSFAGTSNGSIPAAIQYNGFGNVSVVGGNNNFVDGSETLVASISLASTTFSGLSLSGFTQGRAGGLGSGKQAKLTWDTGSKIFGVGDTVASISASDGITEFTLSNVSGAGINLEGFSAEFVAVAVPEPAYVPLAAIIGLLGFARIQRRRRR